MADLTFCAESISFLEVPAVITGVLCVYLAARENVWNWPVAIVNAALYFVVFRRSGLYSDTGLQVVYLTLSIYGWYEWLYGGKNREELLVSRATPRIWGIAVVAGVALWVALWLVTSRIPGRSIVGVDAALTSVSLVAQWMMTRKILENWTLWIVVDVAYVPTFIYKHLCLTSGLYFVYLALAVLGFVQWRRALASAAVA